MTGRLAGPETLSNGRLAGRIALVTGASRGIGRAVAKRFAAEGAEVICVARTQGALEELDDEIADMAKNAGGGGKAVLVPLDLRRFDDIDQMAAAIYQRFGRLDVLVGNAGDIGGGLAPIGHVDQKHFQAAFDINVTANYRLIRAFDPLLRMSEAGRAMFVTSGVTSGGGALPFWGVYAAGKAALEVLVRTWAAEIANITQVKVNLIDPGVVATRMRAIAFPGEDQASLRQPADTTELFVELAEAACRHHGELMQIR